MSISTPWGRSQSVREITEGITQVSTAGHGGLRLSMKRWGELMAKIPYVPKYAPVPWLEEDCDYCLAILRWPEFWPIGSLRSAVQMFSGEGEYQSAVRIWLATSADGMALKAKVKEWETANGLLWEQGTLMSQGRGWNVHFTRVCDRAERTALFAEYPTQHFYTDEEIAALDLPKEKAAPIRPAAAGFNEADCSGVFDGNRVWSETELGGAPGF